MNQHIQNGPQMIRVQHLVMPISTKVLLWLPSGGGGRHFFRKQIVVKNIKILIKVERLRSPVYQMRMTIMWLNIMQTVETVEKLILPKRMKL